MSRFCLVYVEFKKIFQYKITFFVNLSFEILSLLVQLSIFYIFLKNSDSSTLWHQTIIYTIISCSLDSKLSVNSIPEFVESIKDGKVVKYFIRPINLFHQIILQELGNCLIGIVQISPLLLLGICANIYLFGNVGHIFQFIISAGLSILLSVLIANVFFSLTFVTLNYSGIKALLQGVSSLLSGSLVPLILWQDRLVSLLKWTPFAMLIDAPLRVYLNLESFITVITFQLFWCIAFYLVGQVLFKKLPSYCEYSGG